MSRPPSEINSFRMKNSILRAGAGAGKTTTLIRLFEEMATSFKKEQGRFPRIVLTTFTRKATQEIRERLLAEALQKDLPELFRYINSRSKVHISTIHGVLSLYLTQYGKDLGLAPEFKLIDGPEVYFREKRILRNLLLENSEWLELVENFDIKNLLSMLNQYYQQHFLHEVSKPVSQKELSRIAENILSDLASKGFQFYQQISTYELSDSWASYLQKFKILQSSHPISLSGFSELIESLGRKPPFSSKKPPFDEALHQAFDEYIKDCKSWIQNDSLKESFCQRHEQLSQKFESLAKAFCKKNLQERLSTSLLSMSDLEGLALRLIRTSPWTAQKFSDQWDYWMIDEYQDTSPLQVELLKYLVGSSPHFVVGDPQQSIYLFRGARSDVFHAKVEEIRNHDGEVQTALTNYRSRAPLLEFINTYFKGKDAFASMVPFRMEGQDQSCIDIVIVEKEAEQKAILYLVEEKLKGGALPQEICVLARTNRVLQDVAQAALTFNIPVQFHSAGGFSSRREILDFISILKYLANPHDNINLIGLLRGPWFQIPDDQLVQITQPWGGRNSFWNFWNSNKFLAGENILLKLISYKKMADQIGFSETLKVILVERGLIDTSFYVDPTGRREANLWKILIDFSVAEAIPGFNPLQFIENLQASADGQEESDATPVIEPDRVNLMTIHASKGLQFKHVIIAGFGADQRKFQGDWWMIDQVTGQWTLALKTEDQKKISSLRGRQLIEDRQEKETEEADRLLYVAMTRARDSLSLVWTSHPRRGSWASEFPFLKTEGVHEVLSEENKSFKYCVRTQLPDPQVVSETIPEKGFYKIPFQEISSRDHSLTRTSSSSPEGVRILLENSRRGGDLHRFLEALRYQPSLWNDGDSEYSEPLHFLKSLKEIPFEKILSEGDTDWHYVIEVKNQRRRGQVDLWARFENQVWLIDYKVGALKDAKKTLENLEASARAMKEMSLIQAGDQVHLWALYTTQKETRSKVLSAAQLVE